MNDSDSDLTQYSAAQCAAAIQYPPHAARKAVHPSSLLPTYTAAVLLVPVRTCSFLPQPQPQLLPTYQHHATFCEVRLGR